MTISARSILAMWMAMSLLSCRPKEDPIPGEGVVTPERGGILRFASFANLRTIDPPTISEALSSEIAVLMFAGLVDFDYSGKIVPELAESFTVSPDGLRYNFVLRPNVLFHDGSLLTVADVKRSFERALHPKTPNPASSLYHSIVGYKEFSEGTATSLRGVRIVSDREVEIELVAPDATFMPAMALATTRPVCPSAGSLYDPSWHPCGTGPFKMPPGGWNRGTSITLTRHDGYFRPGLPYLDGVVTSFNVHQGTQRYKFARGEQDIFRDLTVSDGFFFAEHPKWKHLVQNGPFVSVWGESLNTELPPFDNVEMRRAVSSAIQRDVIARLRPHNMKPWGRPIPPGLPGADAGEKTQGYDFEKALEHMKNAGYPYDPKTGKGGYPHRLSYVTYRQGLSENSAQLVQQDLAKIGIHLDLKIVSYPTYLTLTQERKRSVISPQGWSQDYPDALDFYDALFTTGSIQDSGSPNSSFYSNEAYDRSLANAKKESAFSARQKFYAEANDRVVEDAPWAFEYTYRFINVHQAYVRNFRPHPMWDRYVVETWLDRKSLRKKDQSLALMGKLTQ